MESANRKPIARNVRTQLARNERPDQALCFRGAERCARGARLLTSAPATYAVVLSWASLVWLPESMMSVASLAGLPAGTRRALVSVAAACRWHSRRVRVSAQELRSAQVPPPQDTPYPGTIAIHVDASDTAQGIFRVHETIPVHGRCVDAAVPAVDSRRPLADRPDRHARRPQAQRQRQAADVEARQVQRLRVPSRRARRRVRDRCRLPVPVRPHRRRGSRSPTA